MPSIDLRGVVMVRAESGTGHPYHVPPLQTAAYRYPEMPHLRCDACRHDQPLSGIVRRVTAKGGRIPLCYDCYEAQTGRAYFGQDEYWDGRRWIPLMEGE